MRFTAVAVGECMLELVRSPVGGWQLGFGGDTYNTAVYLSRLGVSTSYLTATGDDPFSSEMRDAWASDGLDTSLALVAHAKLPGFYAIRTDASGERSFHYWREQSAVRRLFDLPDVDDALACAARAEVLYLSGITLSLFDEDGQSRLRDLCTAVRERGGAVVFDPNYRPRGWADPAAARRAQDAIAPLVSTALPTFADEVALRGDCAPDSTADRWLAAGANEVAIKLGPDGCLIANGTGRRRVPVEIPIRPYDTTGAGDAFNAGYLAARIQGVPPQQAAQEGNALAARVIQYPGAIVPFEHMSLFER